MLLLDRTFSLPELPAVAAQLMQVLGDIRVVTLQGELGAGKTTLVRECCLQYGIADTVSSPTFSIVNEYHGSRGIVYHIDLYRLEDEEEAMRAGVEEYLFGGSLCMVEWPQRASGLLPEKRLEVHLSVIDQGHRRIRVFSHEI